MYVIGQNYWHLSFGSNSSSALGWYHVKVVVKDENDAEVEYQKNKVFEVINNHPELSDLEVSRTNIYRTENLTVNFSASDFEDVIESEMISVYRRYQGGSSSWSKIEFTDPSNSNNDDAWQVRISTNKSDPVGEYDLQIVLEDSDGGSKSAELLAAFLVMNNMPVVELVTIDRTSIERTEVADIFIYGSDIETPQESMQVVLLHMLDVEESEWSNESFSAITWKAHANRWEATFFTNEQTVTGNYSFRAQIIDADSVGSDFVSSETKLEVLNKPPKAVITVSDIEVNEDEEILFDSKNSTDPEDFVLTSVHWDFGDGTESTQDSVYHSYSKSGVYNITLTVMDKNFAVAYSHVTVTIINVQPVADFKVTTGTAELKVGQPILFDGRNTIDTSSDRANLTFHWDFDDGNTSDSANVTHIYSRPGTYIITLTVEDDDGSSSSKIRDLHIEAGEDIPGKDGDEKESAPWYEGQSLFYIIIIIIIVILLVIILVLKRRKDKAKEEVTRSLGMGMKPTKKVGVGVKTGTLEDEESPRSIAPGTMVKRPLPAKSAELDEAGYPTLETEVAEIIAPPKTKALPPQTTKPTPTGTADGDISDVEVEYVPEVKSVVSMDLETSTTDDKDDLDVAVHVHLPSAGEDGEYKEYDDEFADDLTLPEPGSEPVEDSEFVPPEIDLSGIMEPEVEPAQPHRQEITQAKQRGAGMDFSFKKPDEKKKKP
jgi:PKD repeat protein